MRSNLQQIPENLLFPRHYRFNIRVNRANEIMTEAKQFGVIPQVTGEVQGGGEEVNADVLFIKDCNHP